MSGLYDIDDYTDDIMGEKELREECVDVVDVLHWNRESMLNRFSMRSSVGKTTRSNRRTSSLLSVDSLSSVSSTSSSNLELVKNLNDLMLLEDDLCAEDLDINTYRSQVKRLLVNVLVKLEDSVQHQQVLQQDFDRLQHEHTVLRQQLNLANLRVKKETQRREASEQLRHMQLNALTRKAMALSEQIEVLNSNFEEARMNSDSLEEIKVTELQEEQEEAGHVEVPDDGDNNRLRDVEFDESTAEQDSDTDDQHDV